MRGPEPTSGGNMPAHKGALKILLIDANTKDFPAFLQMMASVEAQQKIDRPLELIYTDTLAAGLKQAAKGGIDLVLIGHPLPVGEEESVARIQELFPSLPIIAIAAQKHKKAALEAVKKGGAQGYLLRGKHGTEDLSRLIAQI